MLLHLCRLSLLLPLLLLPGCAHRAGETEQREVEELYYSGDLAGAARRSGEISDAENGETDRNALLWHLEAGSINLDAGNTAESMKHLLRAQKLLYLYDSQGQLKFHQPGRLTYNGYRSDRIFLNMLLFFNYFAEGRFEDALVELRRLRDGQYRTLTTQTEPELLQHEKQNRGGEPLLLARLRDDETAGQTLAASGMDEGMLEYRRRKRPELPLFLNPMAFYLSAIGYYWDNDYEEAAIDLKYLRRMQPDQPVISSDYATVLKQLGETLPADLRGVAPADHPLEDNMVLVIYADGRPAAWHGRQRSFTLPGMVPASWRFSEPAASFSAADGDRLKIEADGKAIFTEPLADLDAVLRDEYWQLMFPRMVSQAAADIRAMTVAHQAAQIQLAAAMAISDPYARTLAISSAQVMLAATSSVSIDQSEWRRWSTLPRRFQIAHLAIPPDRRITVSTAGNFRRSVAIDPDANRAIIYLRRIGDKCQLKLWESLE